MKKHERDPHGKNPKKQLGAKLDHGKPLAGVVADFGLALLAVAAVGTHGIEKYRRGSWAHVPDGEQRYEDAFWRHVLKEKAESIDTKSGLPTKWHTLWNDLARLELELRRTKLLP